MPATVPAPPLGTAALGRAARVAGLLAFLALSGCITGAALVEGETVEMEAGSRATVPFHVEQAGAVHIDVESRNAMPFAVCVVPAASVPAWLQGERREAASCQENVRQSSATIHLPPGDWALAFHCNGVAPCELEARAFSA